LQIASAEAHGPKRELSLQDRCTKERSVLLPAEQFGKSKACLELRSPTELAKPQPRGTINIRRQNNKFIMDNNPHPISTSEWKEIVGVPAVRNAWGLEADTDPDEFASVVYGAKFNFISGGPGYAGDLYVLQGDAITEVPPMVLRRDREGRLIVC